jgi:hypothetical protein
VITRPRALDRSAIALARHACQLATVFNFVTDMNPPAEPVCIAHTHPRHALPRSYNRASHPPEREPQPTVDADLGESSLETIDGMRTRSRVVRAHVDPLLSSTATSTLTAGRTPHRRRAWRSDVRVSRCELLAHTVRCNDRAPRELRARSARVRITLS